MSDDKGYEKNRERETITCHPNAVVGFDLYLNKPLITDN